MGDGNARPEVMTDVGAEEGTLARQREYYREKYLEALDRQEALGAQVDQLNRRAERLQKLYDDISRAGWWRLTKPLRVLSDALKRIPRAFRPSRLRRAAAQIRKQNGPEAGRAFLRDARCWRHDYLCGKNPQYTAEALDAQRNAAYATSVRISLITPLYNTPENYLQEMIRSVLDQTYPNWELCLADGSDEKHGSVGRICRRYAKRDSRIRYRKLPENRGISGNTNACLSMAGGEYVAFLDHDDLLHPAALFEVALAVGERNADLVYTDEAVFRTEPSDAFYTAYKPDYAPDNLRASNYLCHFTAFRRAYIDQLGGLAAEFDGSQDYDMVLRVTERAERIVHLPRTLYYWRAGPGSVAGNTAEKPYAIDAGRLALEKHLERIGLKGRVVSNLSGSALFRTAYAIEGEPLVSILIPNREHAEDLYICLKSIFERTTYPRLEVIVLENGSKSEEISRFYRAAERRWEQLRVIPWTGGFNFSAINNYGAGLARGEYLLLLNNDTEIITPDWIQEMLMFAQRADVGAVGAKLLYPDGTIQHAGMFLGCRGLTGHMHRGAPRHSPGYTGRLLYAQDVSAVTGACLMIRRELWERLGGLDEEYQVVFNDVDLCLRARMAGYLNVWTPFAELYHNESSSRGADDTPEKLRRYQAEANRFRARWGAVIDAGDPYYNPNLTREREDMSEAEERADISVTDRAEDRSMTWQQILEEALDHRSICVFAPLLSEKCGADGYTQRIRVIDQTVLGGYRRFYLKEDRSCAVLEVTRTDEDLYEIRYDGGDWKQHDRILELIRACRKLYVHSIYRFIGNEEMLDALTCPNVFCVWDVHGAVPEELRLCGNTASAEAAAWLEREFYMHSQVIVCVTNAMAEHLRSKYGGTTARFVILPIFDSRAHEARPSDGGEEKRLPEGQSPLAVYAGGLQKWQNIGQMQALIKTAGARCRYRILVPDPAAFWRLWGARDEGREPEITVASVSPEEMDREYRACHFGLALRDDLDVNRVACPTKIIEYLQYGIIPVLKCPLIGDFVSMGMKYVPESDFLAGRIPDEPERRKMIQGNYEVFRQLMEEQKRGIGLLKLSLTESAGKM